MTQTVLAVFSGISLAFAVLSFSVYILNRNQSVYILFAAFSLFSGVYFLLGSLSKMGVNGLGWSIILSAALYYAIFPWFLFRFVGKKGNKILWGVSTLFLLAFLAYIMMPKVDDLALWQIIAHVGLGALMIIAIYVSVTFRSRSQMIRREFMILCFIFVVLGMEEIIRTYTGQKFLTKYIQGMQPLDIYPLLFTFSMGIRLSNDFIHRKELEVQRILGELKQKKLELAQMESKKLRDEIEFKKKDLKLFGMKLNRKTEYTTSLIGRMNSLKRKNPIKSADLDEVIKYTKTQLRIDQNLEYFHSNIDVINNEFLSNLKEKYPGLTQNELHLSSLLRLKLNTKEIANIKNISPDSVKVLRYRLRKKFDLKTKDNLVDFLHGF